MPLDPSILFRLDTKGPDLGGALQQGMSMRKSMDDSQRQKVVQGREDDAHLKEKAKQIIWSIKDQPSYEAAKSELAKIGAPGLDQWGPEYNPEVVKLKQYASLTPEQQVQKQQFDAELVSREKDREASRNQAYALAKIAAGARADEKEEKRTEKKERQIETDMAKLSKDVEGTQGMMSALDETEAVLGGPLESFSVKNGGLYKGGKAVDLPGVSIPGIGRVSAHSDQARRLNDTAKTVFNATLKDRSGGAVTDNELDRLRTEFSEGKFNTEPELIDALQRYKRRAAVVLKNREAGYTPEVVNRYTDQGGRTSKTIKSADAGGKTIAKKQYSKSANKTKVIYSDGTEEILDGQR